MPTVPATAAGNAKVSRYAWRKLAWPIALACGFLVFVGASSIYLVASSQSSQEMMNRALQLENKLWAIIAVVGVAESEQRGYLLTDNPGYLEVYHNTIDAGAAAVADLRTAIADDPVQQRALAEIESLMLRKFAELQETMRLHGSDDHAAAMDLVRTGVGHELMTRIRVATTRLMDEQRHLVLLRTSNSVSTSIWLLVVNLVGLALIIVLAAISILAVRWAAAKDLGQSESRGDELRAVVSERRENEQKLKDMLEAAPDAMVVLNRGGEIMLLNPRAEKQFGYRRDELLGQKVTNIIPDGFAERLVADGLRSPADALTQQIGTGIELVGRRKDGAEFPIEIMLSPLECAEGMLVTAAIRDISARKHNKRLKDEFVSTVNHELRTPLTSIAGSLGLLAEQWADELPKSAARLLAIAHTNSQRLVRLVNDILDIEKLESSRVVFNWSQVDLRSLVAHAIEENRGFAASYGVHVRLDTTSADIVVVNADPDRLAQVVTNLLSNAIKFSPAGEEVLVAVENNGNITRISVRDHGCGVPDDFKSHIFEKFAQADGTTSRQKGGTGLGLSIVKQIVERSGGVVRFDDAPGGGTIFFVELPAWNETISGEVDLGSDPGAIRILLCEDDRDAAIVLRKALRRAGFALDFAYTMSAGVVRASATRYAAILVDLELPGGDGIDLILRIRANAHHRDTPVIVIAGDPDRGRSDVRSSHLNILDWLRKPLDFDNLVVLLKAALAAQPKRLRILHVDDDHDVRALVTHALRSTADVISADSLAGARRALATEPIDVVVLEIAIGADSGLDLLPGLRDSRGNAVPVIIFANNGAGVPCGEQVEVALSKSNASLEHLREEVRERLALLATRPLMEVA